MRITKRDHNGVAVFVLEGRVDSVGAGEMDAALQTAVGEGRHRNVLDMAGVTYINSAGLRTLADAVTRARARDGDLRLAALTPKVARVLKIIGFDRFFDEYPTTEDAYVGL